MKSLLIIILFFIAPLSSFAEEEKDFFETTVMSHLEECKDHFDIEPYFKLAIGADFDESVADEVLISIETFMHTGRLPIPEDQKDSSLVVRCATFAEGMMVGGFGREIVSTVSRVLGEAIGEAFGRALESLGQGFEQGFEPQLFEPPQSANP